MVELDNYKIEPVEEVAKFEDYIGKEMVHLAKFESIPNFESGDWVTSICQGSGDFIKNWNKSKERNKILNKYDHDVDKLLDRAYMDWLNHERSQGNNISKLPKSRPSKYTFEYLTNQNDLEKYLNDKVINKDFKIIIYNNMMQNKTKLMFDRNGDKIKKY